MTEEFSHSEGLALWRQLKAAEGRVLHRPGSGIGAMEVATWLEGRADEALAARVEAALAADSALLDAALAARQPDDLEAPAAMPERLLIRARAMVAPAMRPARTGFAGMMGRWRYALQWTTVAASLLVAAAAGFWIGGGAGEQVLVAEHASSSIFDTADSGTLLTGEGS